MSEDYRQKMRMTDEEIRDYLANPRLGRIATTAGRKPHVAVIWYDYDGETLSITTGKSSKKIRNIQKNRNISVIIDSTLGGYFSKGVILEGKADLADDEPDKKITRSMYERYVGPQALEHPMTKELLKYPRTIIKLKPARVISWDFTKIMTSEAFESRKAAAWINTVSESEARGTVKEIYSALRASFGIVPNIYKALSLSPSAMSAFFEYLSSFKTGSTSLPQELKFMIGILVARLNACPYCIDANMVGLSFSGMPEERIRAVAKDYRKADLDARTVELLKFVGKLTESSSKITNADIDWLRKLGWSDQQIIEATVVASFENALSRIANALGVDISDLAVLKNIMLSRRGAVAAGKMCPECGSSARPDANFCSNCGAKLRK